MEEQELKTEVEYNGQTYGVFRTGTQIQVYDDDLLFTIYAPMDDNMLKQCIRTYFIGLKDGEKRGRGDAQGEIRRALGL